MAFGDGFAGEDVVAVALHGFFLIEKKDHHEDTKATKFWVFAPAARIGFFRGLRVFVVNVRRWDGRPAFR
jgi:hypothetical protein